MGFASADATSAQATGGAGGRVPVGFGPQRHSDIEARSSVCRWIAGFGSRKAVRVSWGHPYAGGIWLGGGGKDGGDGGVPVCFCGRNQLGSSVCQAARMEVTAACAGGICFCGCNQRQGDGRCWRPRAGGIWSTEAQR